MELQLQLGLALPSHNPSKGFDLMNNNSGFEEAVETLSSKSWKDGDHVKNKRSFEEAFGKIRDESEMVPLLLWSGQPNDEDHQDGLKKKNSPTSNKKEEEEKLVVGWPPIQSWRKKLLHQGHQVGRIDQNSNRRADQKGNNNGAGSNNSMYVKVKMEGVAIARKIDLRLYHSFETLTNSLIPMFTIYQKCEKRLGVQYTLTYQNKEGDWLLAGDVPWQTFIESVQRLEILKNSG